MKLHFYRHPIASNFGDELNLWLWPKLLDDVLDHDEKALFIGIGSILTDDYPGQVRKYVMGAGYGAYRPPPVMDDTWHVSFVRGPRTAHALGLDRRLAITDGAVLVRAVHDATPVPRRHRISFLPHWYSAYSGRWQQACRWAGINLIDPRKPVAEVLEEISMSGLVIAEAMHGAIVADALRVPWIPVLPLASEHRMKWVDWTESLGLDYAPFRLAPTSWGELRSALAPAQGATNRSARTFAGLGGTSRLRRMAHSSIGRRIERTFAMGAAARLQVVSRKDPVLSRDSVIGELTERALAKVHAFKRAHRHAVA